MLQKQLSVTLGWTEAILGTVGSSAFGLNFNMKAMRVNKVIPSDSHQLYDCSANLKCMSIPVVVRLQLLRHASKWRSKPNGSIKTSFILKLQAFIHLQTKLL